MNQKKRKTIRRQPRYFFASYTCDRGDGNLRIYMLDGMFPSNEQMKDWVVRDHPDVSRQSIVVMNLFEFKNRRDYDEFIAPKKIDK